MGYSLAFYKDKTGSGILTLSKFQRIVTIFAFLVVTGAFIFNALNHHSLWINGFFLILTFYYLFFIGRNYVVGLKIFAYVNAKAFFG